MHHTKNIVPPKLINGQYAAVASIPNATANPINTKIANNPNVPMDNCLLNLSLVFRIVSVRPLAMHPYNAKINNPINMPNFAIILVNAKTDIDSGNTDKKSNDFVVLPTIVLLANA